MRDEKIEQLLSIAGNENRYQYFALFIFLILWINCNFMAPVLPYLEREPIVKYNNENKTLNFDICDSKNYEIIERFGYSWVSEFGIECDKFSIGLIGAFTFIGNTMGSVAFAIVQKYFSHKNILLLSSWFFIFSIYFATLIHDANYFFWILISLVFMGLFGDLLCYSSLVVCEEIISSRKRAFFSSIINMGYGLCGIIYSFIWIAKFNGLEKEFLEKFESDEYQKLIKDIMEYDYYNNNKDIEMNEIESNDKNNKLINSQQKNNNHDKKVQISAFISLKYPSLRYKFLILCILWFGTRSTSNCIALYSKALPGNYYFNIIILFAFESIAYIISGLLINLKFLGRKGTLYSQYFIITIGFLLLSFIKFSLPVELTLNFIIRFCAAAIELVYFTYTLEVYPTPIRSVNFGVNVTCGNIGSILAPMVYEYLPSWMFLFIFALLSIFHSILLVFLPETEGKPMIESIDEINNDKYTTK